MIIYALKALRRTHGGADLGGRHTRWNPANALFRPAHLTQDGLAYRRKCFVAAKVFLASVAIPLLVSGAIVACDIWNDRRHSVVLSQTVPLFGEPRLDCGRLHPTPTGFVAPSEQLQVQRIRYGKDCRTVRVSTSTGNSGWLLEDDSVSLSKQ